MQCTGFQHGLHFTGKISILGFKMLRVLSQGHMGFKTRAHAFCLFLYVYIRVQIYKHMCANAGCLLSGATHLVFLFCFFLFFAFCFVLLCFKQNLSLTQAGLAGLLFVLFYADSEDLNSGPCAYSMSTYWQSYLSSSRTFLLITLMP